MEVAGVSQGQSWCPGRVFLGTVLVVSIAWRGRCVQGEGMGSHRAKTSGGEDGRDETCSAGGRQSTQRLSSPNRQ